MWYIIGIVVIFTVGTLFGYYVRPWLDKITGKVNSAYNELKS